MSGPLLQSLPDYASEATGQACHRAAPAGAGPAGPGVPARRGSRLPTGRPRPGAGAGGVGPPTS
ncbi:hypothetical protein PP1_020775 [Pseudonocardia sp. P1]